MATSVLAAPGATHADDGAVPPASGLPGASPATADAGRRDPLPLHAAPACPDVVPLETLGPGCLGDDGLFTVYDLEGNRLGRTHEPDPARSDGPGAGDRNGTGQDPTTLPERDPACTSDPTLRHYVHIIEAHAEDDPYEDRTDRILSLTRKADHVFDQAAQVSDRHRDIRVLCDGQGDPRITTLTLPTPKANATFSSIAADIRASQHADGPLDDPDVKYWVYYQDAIDCGCAGVGTTWTDDTASVTNGNNGGTEVMFAVLFDRDSVRTWLHELAHTMGAVQHSAPHSTGASHCNDGQDIMCYADGGPSADYDPSVCPDWDTFDCGQDDYFDADPDPLSYLDTHWNLAHPRNRYIEGCQRVDGRIPLGIGGMVKLADPIYASVSHSIDVACQGHTYVLEGPSRFKFDSRRVEHGNDVDVCWIGQGVVIECDERIGLASEGIVPVGADEARITAKAGVNVAYSLRIG